MGVVVFLVTAALATAVLGIGASPASVIEAWRTDDVALEELSDPALRRYGVAIANGPAGRLAVLVATG